ncbi:MAG: hypothetical protein HZA50_15275 [Planctomycetes bacterium]|nr:hypothetical protein [Planctomycetota bacterium]
MAEETNEIKRINWTEVFGFTQIFKSFKLAIHPAKLALAFAAIALLFLLGKGLDLVWSTWGGYAINNEIVAYNDCFENDQLGRFAGLKKAELDARLNRAAGLYVEYHNDRLRLDKYKEKFQPQPGEAFAATADQRLEDYNKNTDKDFKAFNLGETLTNADKDKTDWHKLCGKAEDGFGNNIEKIQAILKGDFEDAAKKKIKEKTVSDDEKKKLYEGLERDMETSQRALTAYKVAFNRKVRDIRGEGISKAFLGWQNDCLIGSVNAVRKGCLISNGDVPSVLSQAKRSAAGTMWLISQHWVYAAIFLAVGLGIVAVFGGAVHRIAALHFARDEKISVGQALKFSLGKFLSFYSAPLIPIAIILLLGGLTVAGALLTNIPWVGEILVGVLFFLALLLGLVAAFLFIGLVTGFGLMYPTIAVEGSDSFDAISRSFSYVFAQPWRAGFYAVVSLVYGTITYLFVRAFAFIALASTHAFAKWGVWTGGQTLAEGADKIDVMWAAPSFWSLMPAPTWEAMTFCQKIGAFCIQVYVFVIAGLVLAYLLSFAASSTTSIYCLLRKQVDATDLDDVYVEETPVETPGATPAPVAAATAAPAAPAAPADPAKPA